MLSAYAAAFLAYAVTWALTWDESYNLLAAQLMAAGKRPYLDFCFPQTPLNAYWNAGWMRLSGTSWRVPHFFAAAFTIGAVVLTADYVLRYFPVPNWRLGAAITAALATGLNVAVFEFAPLAQAYGICLLGLAAAFRFIVRAVDTTGASCAAAAGLAVGVAAGSSLLTAAAVPVFMLWMWLHNRAGNRLRKLAAFAIGLAIPFAPVYWLFWLGPRQTWFNLVEYHLFFRKLYWPNTTQHDFGVLTAWIDSPAALVFGLFALVGIWWIARKSAWPPTVKAEFGLCGWLAAALALAAGLAHPTFERYFLLTAPFLAILAAAGLYGAASRIPRVSRPLWPVLAVSLLFAAGVGKLVFGDPEDEHWSMYERLAAKVDQVTPPDAQVFADEPIYFLTGRTPPSGFELAYTHKVKLPPAELAQLHIITEPEMAREVQSGMFATAYSCNDQAIDYYGLRKLYAHRADLYDCSIFWGFRK